MRPNRRCPLSRRRMLSCRAGQMPATVPEVAGPRRPTESSSTISRVSTKRRQTGSAPRGGPGVETEPAHPRRPAMGWLCRPGADGAEAMKCRLTSSGGANQPPTGPPVDARLGPAAGRHELLPARPSGRRYRPARQRVWPTAGRPRPAAVGATRRRHRGPRSATGGPRRARGPAPPPPGRRASSRPSTSWVATASCPAACRSSSIAFSRSGS